MSIQLSKKDYQVLNIANEAFKTESSFEVGIRNQFKWIETHPQMKVFEMASYITNLIHKGYLQTDASCFDIGETYCSKYDSQVDAIHYDNLLITKKGQRAILNWKFASIFGFNQVEVVYIKGVLISVLILILRFFYPVIKEAVMRGLH